VGVNRLLSTDVSANRDCPHVCGGEPP